MIEIKFEYDGKTVKAEGCVHFYGPDREAEIEEIGAVYVDGKEVDYWALSGDLQGAIDDAVVFGAINGAPHTGLEPEFADPGGSSALRAASPSNPRNLPCPSCGTPNRLTPADRDRGYQCDSCADRAERGW